MSFIQKFALAEGPIRGKEPRRLLRADLCIVAKRVQRVFDLLPEWLDKWRTAVNVSKTAALLTGSQRNMPNQLRLRDQAIAHRDKTSDLLMLHTLPPDLRCTGLVCPLLKTAAPMSLGPAKYSAPYDGGDRVVRQKRRDRQRFKSRNHRGIRKDAGATHLQSRRRSPLSIPTKFGTTLRPTDERILALTKPAIQITQREEVDNINFPALEKKRQGVVTENVSRPLLALPPTRGEETALRGRTGIGKQNRPPRAGLYHPTTKLSSQNMPLGDNIKTIMSVLRVVKSAGFAELASDFRRARTGEDRLAVMLAHQNLLTKLESL
ncbi:hypothetical protein EVAR_70468_1 [Eumeta japonica]|uniref:Uncharacterized protein n=1 Tax=Eumeta variegata TaxID=151549 RepID=A0A4C2A5P6_EUMVA|nr:hypothetical protein EVAR_70468_1 [Eumeta japonica]